MTTEPKHPNPYDYINPVADDGVFAGRTEEIATIEEEIKRLASAVPIAPMVALVGERRVGKTSLLLQVAAVGERHNLLPVLVSLTDTTASDPWEFWREAFDAILRAASEAALVDYSPSTGDIGYLRHDSAQRDRGRHYTARLKFAESYFSRRGMPPSQLIQDDFEVVRELTIEGGRSGVLLMLDEAHLLVQSRDVCQEIRSAIRQVGRCGIVFAGEPHLGQMFNDKSQPFFAQARIIHLGNFVRMQDIAECAILPLTENERPLMSPMSIEYLARMSQGKPNQIRLICNSIYRRYEKGQQDDLDITIEALDDVLENIATAYVSDYDLTRQVQAIQTLSSVDLEALHNMTRYPDWHMDDLVQLDESFRGQSASTLAASRRARVMDIKRQRFVDMGLLRDEPGRCLLAGDEFLHMYLRFWYEVRKFGALTKRLALGKGPSTPFAERVEKLVRFVSSEISSVPDIVAADYLARDQGTEGWIARIRHRFRVLDDLLGGTKLPKTATDIVAQCSRICELVDHSGRYHLIALALRNLDNPRESAQVEIYFKDELLLVPIAELKRQAEMARLWVEELDYWAVDLPDIADLLEALKAPSLDQIMRDLPLVERWRIASVRRHLRDRQGKTQESKASDGDKEHPWIERYEKGDHQGAIAVINKELAKSLPRNANARLYNDRGYIRYGHGEGEQAMNDLQRAVDLHSTQLPITLLNLSVGAIDAAEYDRAIDCIDDALFLTLDRQYIPASHLRLRLPRSHLPIATREFYEQHPADVIEAAYINLAYTLLHSEGVPSAMDALQEGLELAGSSTWLNYALARLHLHRKRADLADPIYSRLSAQPITDEKLANEVRLYIASFRQKPSRRGRKRRR